MLGGGSSVNDVRAVVFGPTGKTIGDSRQIAIGEAQYYAGNWIIANPVTEATNQSCANQINLTLNRFTGGVKSSLS